MNFSIMGNGTIYEPNDINQMLQMALIGDNSEYIISYKQEEYYNIPCGFDIETTSFFRLNGKCMKDTKDKDREKVATMYEWTLGINGLIMIGRTWQEFINVLNEISEILKLSPKRKLICYVHNLSFEFQFIRKWIEWDSVFSMETHEPLYALSTLGIEFRCSYLLSGYNLEKLGENLQKYKVEKKVGDLDYNLMRHSKTPLTEKEIGYCVNDVLVVMCYIQEKIETDGNIAKIPLTKTGYVRNYCRKECFYRGMKNNKANKFYRQAFYKKYKEFIHSLNLTEDEYIQLKRTFAGGFTHANAYYVGETIKNVESQDFTSSYPAVMVSEKFPMSSSEMVEIKSKDEFQYNIQNFCCMFDCLFENIYAYFLPEQYISFSKCYKIENYVLNNGRVVSADILAISITEQDYMIIKKVYKWSSMKITKFRRYHKGYLPTDFVKSILTMYANKTELKEVEGKEIEYLINKEMINSAYGMIVTDIVRDEIIYDNEKEWISEIGNKEELIEKYNKSKKRFLYYPWGVWTTAYSRKNLWTGILSCKEDYIYSDTDSIKFINKEKHERYFKSYNEMIMKKMERALKFHNIPLEKIMPQTIKGIKKILGVWDYDGSYSRFKTLGAKRYLMEKSKDKKIILTVAGLGKKIACSYMIEKWGDNVFDYFTDDLYIPSEFTGKLTHTYIENEINGIMQDYLGNNNEFYEKSSVHLYPADYSLSITREYKDFLYQIKTIAEN